MKAIISDIDSKDLRDRPVFLRVDFNVPLIRTLDGIILVGNDSKIRQSLPTINHLRSVGSRIVIYSHLGRPEGKKNLDYSMSPISKALGVLIGDDNVAFVDDCIGPVVQEAINKLPQGKVLVCENTRFYAEEEANVKEFSAALAAPFIKGKTPHSSIIVPSSIPNLPTSYF